MSTHRPTYRSWIEMRRRCRNSWRANRLQDACYADVTCDPAWSSYQQFLEDMGQRPEGYTLDRIDSKAAYGPSNCRWATPRQQSNNRKDNTILTCCGVSQTLAEWSRQTGVSRHTIQYRLRSNWDERRAIGF
jgi:hypothetical protein